MKSIRTKIVLSIFLCVAFASGIIGLSTSYMNFQSTMSTLEATLTESAKIAANQVDQSLEGYRMLITEFSFNQSLVGDNPKEEKLRVLEALRETHDFKMVTLMDKDGIDLATGADFSGLPAFANARDKGGAFISDPIIAGQEMSLYLSYPMEKNGAFNGAIVLQIDAKLLSDIVSEIRVGDGHSSILSKDGTVIGDMDTQKVLNQYNVQKEAESDPSLKQAAAVQADMGLGNSGFSDYADEGVKELVAYCAVPNTNGWSIDVAVSRSKFLYGTNVCVILTFMLFLLATVFSVIVAVIIGKGISNPIKGCVERIRLLAEGDLHTEVPKYTAKDETGVLSSSTLTLVERLRNVITDIDQALDKMADGDFAFAFNRTYRGDFQPLQVSITHIMNALNSALTAINQSADQVSDGSEQVSGGAQALSQGATEQASSIEQLSASIVEISDQVKHNARNAGEANERAGRVGVELEESNKHMNELMEAMKDISSSSNEIGKIIKTIEDIAFQTNILALNAAVEAARAGEAGKGFAVVADEVRNLASKSAEAASDTTELIESSIVAVDRGTKMADNTAHSLVAVVEGSKEIVAAVDRISEASAQQAEAIDQVTLGVEQISAVVQTNSATAEESAAASEELSGQAASLKNLVSKFHLRQNS